MRKFDPPPNRFDGVIGGPPCQVHSTASRIAGTDAVDLIPEFLRVVASASPRFVVMENVTGTLGHPLIPREWYPAVLRDWDCGGLTSRRRVFYTWPHMVMAPARRPGKPCPSVMASTAKRGASGTRTYAAKKSFLPGDLPLEEYARLQGVEVARVGQLRRIGVSRQAVVHMLGNGVPLPMGRWIARATREMCEAA